MNKKIIAIGLIGVLLLTSFSVTGNNTKNIELQDTTTTVITDELDQYQNETQGDIPLFIVGRFVIPTEIDIYVQVAQSFVPTKNLLTRVELLLARNESTSYPFVVAIRDNLTHENLVETSVAATVINNSTMDWVDFDFDDLRVDIGKTYYIVAYTDNVTDNFYGWAANNDSGSYPYGDAWYSLDGGDTWDNESKEKNTQPREKGIKAVEEPPGDNRSDMCFKTYGADFTDLTISIPKFGRNLHACVKNTGTINATDLEFNVTITGGILGFINANNVSITSDLSPENCTTTVLPVFGFGPVSVKATAEATNAFKAEKEMSGFIIFRFLILMDS